MSYTQKSRGVVSPSDSDNFQYTLDELGFLKAMDKYKRENGRPYPAWHEVLAVLHSLGYRKVEADEYSKKEVI